MARDDDERHHFRRRKTDEQKEIFKEALHEWLDEQFARFGRWSLYGIAACAFVATLHIIIAANFDTLRAALEQFNPHHAVTR